MPNNEWRPAALWAFKAYEGDKDFLNYFLKKLERFVAGLLIRRIHSNYRAAKYAELLRQLLNGDGLEAKAFDLSAEEKQEMMKQLNTEIYLQPQYICRYILMRLNSLAAGHYEVSNNKKIAIEHVLPQHPDPDSGWSQNFTEPAVEYWTNRLGNLLPLNRKKRRTEAQGFEFEKKKEVYFGSIVSDSIIFTLTEQVINETEWTPTVVEARHRHMLNTLYDVWSLK
ncbi:HNH endonuclease family protein [Rothia aeria]|nr:HNH endonuclease family protein [Rothia aeria]